MAEGVDGDLAAAAEFEMGQAGAAEVGDDGGPVDDSSGVGHEVGSRWDGSLRPILPTSRRLLNMLFTERLQ
jgi:hypothetical protein